MPGNFLLKICQMARKEKSNFSFIPDNIEFDWVEAIECMDGFEMCCICFFFLYIIVEITRFVILLTFFK